MHDDSHSDVIDRRYLGVLSQQPEQMVANVLAGLVVSLVAIIFNISYAALIFSGPLAPYLPFGISAALISLVVSALVVSFLNSLPILCGGPDSLTAAIVAVIVGNVATTLIAAGLTEALFPTTLAAFVIATTLTGAVLWAAGKFELGYWVRYIPYPVIGGFLAGTGWLITRGGIKVMSEVLVEFGQLGHLLQGNVLMLWLPGVIFALALLVVNRFYNHFLIIPGFVVGAIALFIYRIGADRHQFAASGRGWLALSTLCRNSLCLPADASDFGTGQLGSVAGAECQPVCAFLDYDHRPIAGCIRFGTGAATPTGSQSRAARHRDRQYGDGCFWWLCLLFVNQPHHFGAQSRRNGATSWVGGGDGRLAHAVLW